MFINYYIFYVDTHILITYFICGLVAESCPALCKPMDCSLYQAPLSMEFFRQEYWSGLPLPPPGDLPHLGTESTSIGPPALAGRFFITRATWEAP